MLRVNVFQPNGVARTIELDSAEHIPATGRAFPMLGLRPYRCIVDPNDPTRRISVYGWIATRIGDLLESDPTDTWHNLHVTMGRVYYHRKLGICFCEVRTGRMPSHTVRYFELTPDETSAWFKLEGIENPCHSTGPGLPEPPSGTKAPVATSGTKAKQAKRLKQPSDQAIQCYRLKFILGTEKTQKGIAKEVYGDPERQWQVSRVLKAVEAWIKAGNILPDLEEGKPKMYSTDPSKLDKGPAKKRGRTRR